MTAAAVVAYDVAASPWTLQNVCRALIGVMFAAGIAVNWRHDRLPVRRKPPTKPQPADP